MVLGGLNGIERMLKRQYVVKGENDWNELKFGIYSYYIEDGLPKNSPTGLSRGIALCLYCPPHYGQIILNYDSISTVFVRTSYNGTVWADWQKILTE